MYDNFGFIVHFIDQEKIPSLASGFRMLGIKEFEEGDLPRKLYMVSMEKI